jgi:hypothetical protein
LARKRYVILYSHHKEHVSAQEHEQLWLRQEVKATADPLVWRYIGHERTLHSMVELGQLRPAIERRRDSIRRFLPGNYIIVWKDKRQFERLETPEGMAARLSE